jgi:MFS transporter, SP family, galactose:H+ symporter
MGRKPLLLYGVSLIGLGMLILSISFAAGMSGGHSTSQSLHSIAIMSVYILSCSLITAGYSIGFGPVSWLLQSELFPTVIRGRTMALSVLVSNCTQFLSTLVFLPLVSAIGDSLTFLLFFVTCCLAYVFIAGCLIETKEQQPEEILQSYRLLVQRFVSVLSPLSVRPLRGREQRRRNIQFAAVSNVLIGSPPAEEEEEVKTELTL